MKAHEVLEMAITRVQTTVSQMLHNSETDSAYCGQLSNYCDVPAFPLMSWYFTESKTILFKVSLKYYRCC